MPEGGPTQASQQASRDGLAATAVEKQDVSAGVAHLTQHPASHDQPLAPKPLTATAGVASSCTAAAADGEAAAAVADDKGGGSSVTAAADAASKQSFSQPAPSTPVTASTAGVSARLGAMGKSAGDAEGRQSNLPATTPAQTAADMLSWLDATLSAKKPLKAAASAPSKVQPELQNMHACWNTTKVVCASF